jgi:ABC-type transport system involved in multi-copper enzyme maturation permease subunit
MKIIATFVWDTFLQQVRGRIFLVVLLFGVVMTAASLLFGAVSADQEIEVIRDVGLATTELFALATAALGAVTLVLSEIENRSLYAVLARPLPRWTYVVGRVVGLWLAVLSAAGVMTLVHVALLMMKGWRPEAVFFSAFPFLAMKLAVVTALAMMVSVMTTSPASALVFTSCLWMLGHFVREIRFMGEKAGPTLALAVKAVLAAVPNLQSLNARDAIGVGSAPWSGCLHAALYAAACVTLAAGFFKRKEF